MSNTFILPPEEIDCSVQSLRKFQVEDVGSPFWMEVHEILLKLCQQAVLEVSTHQEEVVKDLIIGYEKLPVLVHEAYCILVWRTKVLPKLLRIDPEPKASFMIYTVLFHEATLMSLLEVVLYHENGCEALRDKSLDLIDYCVFGVTQLVGLVNLGHQNTIIDPKADTEKDMERQKRDLLYKIGMKCLVILSYFVDKCDCLPLSSLSRFVKTHDTPCLLSEILHCKPWIRYTCNGIEKFIDDTWTSVSGDEIAKVTKVEAQTWFCFRQIMLNSNIMRNYEINEFRQRELAKCQALMNEVLLDQLPPLNELKHVLCTLTISGNPSTKNIILEEVPQIRENLLEKARRTGFQEIVKKHAKIFIELDKEEVIEAAKKLQSAYNLDALEELEVKLKRKPKCGTCRKSASKQCSKCESVYYCSRECQVKDWPKHKNQCSVNAKKDELSQ